MFLACFFYFHFTIHNYSINTQLRVDMNKNIHSKASFISKNTICKIHLS